MENRICKNKKCKKSLPEEYKHRYCESCRNQHIENFGKTGKVLLTVVASIAMVIVTKGKINPED